MKAEQRQAESGVFQRKTYRFGIPGLWHEVPKGTHSKNYKEWRRLFASRTLRPINYEIITAVEGNMLKVSTEVGYPNKGKANSHRGPYIHTLDHEDPRVIKEQIPYPKRTILYRSKGNK